MPQASEELRKEWGPGEFKAEKFLLRADYTITPGGVIQRPPNNSSMTDQEQSAIDFLIDEWDYAFHSSL